MLSYQSVPNEKHIICGRGAKIYNHRGNMRFRQLVERDVPLYMKSPKKMKTGVIEKIISEIHNENMAFVEYSTREACWKELTKEESRKKVAHRFRDFVRKELYAKLIDESDPVFQEILLKVKTNEYEFRFLDV